MNRTLRPLWRALLDLGRVSNLPTVWSNCLAGWWLSGGGSLGKLPFLLLGVSALYTGGAFLNDAFDANYDRQRRTARPIPSGRILPGTVWRYGWVSLVLGLICLLILGNLAGAMAAMLAACILTYNATHKFIIAAPWLLGLCRFWVYVIAGTTGMDGLNGWPIWCGAALGFYQAGVSYFAQLNLHRGPLAHWPLVLLGAPILLALLMNAGGALTPALWVSLIVTLWMAVCGRTLFEPGAINVDRVVSGLLAGIVLVDWLAVAPQCPRALSIGFLILFGATRFLQRFMPAV